MVEIDMTREPETGFLTGINLWQVAGLKVERSQKSGEMMLKIKFKSGEFEMEDNAMLGGKGWGIGRKKLLALGIDPAFKGSLDTTELYGRKVWLATREGSYSGVDKKTSAPRTYKRCEVDINQLENCGYQAEANVPAGANAPVAGSGPIDDETPF